MRGLTPLLALALLLAAAPSAHSGEDAAANFTAAELRMLADYGDFQKQVIQFARVWEEWAKLHKQNASGETYDYKTFKREAELWKRVKELMAELRSHRAGKRYSQPEKRASQSRAASR